GRVGVMVWRVLMLRVAVLHAPMLRVPMRHMPMRRRATRKHPRNRSGVRHSARGRALRHAAPIPARAACIGDAAGRPARSGEYPARPSGGRSLAPQGLLLPAMVAGTRRRTQPGHRSRWTRLTALAAPNAQVSRFLDVFDAFVEAVRGLADGSHLKYGLLAKQSLLEWMSRQNKRAGRWYGGTMN
ncbi:hypothetical protein, partial [Burkholderia multivorans]